MIRGMLLPVGVFAPGPPGPGREGMNAMKVICDRGALLEGVNLVSGVVASRSPRQQLLCVKIEASVTDDGGRLDLTATDAEISLKLSVDRVDVQEPGQALIPADKLRQIISAEDADATLALETDGQSCTIRGKDAYFKVLGYPPEEFPAIPSFAEAAKSAKGVFSHRAGSLSELISRTLFATARENSRYAINGVLVKRDGKRLEFVATDGRRLAIARADLDSAGGNSGAGSSIVPSKALITLQRIASDPNEPVRIAITDNRILFAVGGTEEEPEGRACLSSNLVEGAFPPYEDVVPRDHDKTIVFDRDVMSSAVRRAALLTSEDHRGVELRFDASEKQLQLSSSAPEMGEAKVTVDLLEYKGDDITVGFNPMFLSDALKVVSEQSITFELRAPNKPGVMKVGGDFIYVVMPVNIQ